MKQKLIKEKWEGMELVAQLLDGKVILVTDDSTGKSYL